MTPARTTCDLTAQHLVLMTQHQQLDVLGQIRPDQHHQQAEQAPDQPVQQRQQHPVMVAATAAAPQQNPSSQHQPNIRAVQAGPRGSTPVVGGLLERVP